MIPPPTGPPLWRCLRRIGFLFPHPCVRTTPIGCPHCRGGEIEDPFRERSDRHLYSDDYDTYSPHELSSGSEAAFAGFGGGDAGGGGASSDFGSGDFGSADFTEADGESFDDSSDSGGDFENDLSAS